MMPQPTEQCVQMVLTCSALPPVLTAASAFFIITGDSVVASAAPPAIRLELRRKARRLIASGTARLGLTSTLGSTLQDLLINFFMIFPLDLNAGRLVIVENVLG